MGFFFLDPLLSTLDFHPETMGVPQIVVKVPGRQGGERGDKGQVQDLCWNQTLVVCWLHTLTCFCPPASVIAPGTKPVSTV
jgi:hypothetical protein